MSAMVTAAEKERLAILESMPVPTQKIARQIEQRVNKTVGTAVMARYLTGTDIMTICADEGRYGGMAVRQIARYIQLPGGEADLYNMRNFATCFAKDYIEKYAVTPMANGRFLSVDHWYQLMRVLDAKKRHALLQRVLVESLSAASIEQEIRTGAAGDTRPSRSGGRKPLVPNNAVLMAAKYNLLLQSFNRYDEAADNRFPDMLNSTPPDRMDEKLLQNLTEARDAAHTASSRAKSVQDACQKGIDRVQRVLDARKDKPTGKAETKALVAAKPSSKLTPPAGKAGPARARRPVSAR